MLTPNQTQHQKQATEVRLLETDSTCKLSQPISQGNPHSHVLGTANFPSKTAMPPPTLTFSHNIVHKKLPYTHRINSSFDRHKKKNRAGQKSLCIDALLKLIQEKLPHLVPGLATSSPQRRVSPPHQPLNMKNNLFCWVEHPESSPKHQNLISPTNCMTKLSHTCSSKSRRSPKSKLSTFKWCSRSSTSKWGEISRL